MTESPHLSNQAASGNMLLTREGMSPLLVVSVELAIPNVELKPNSEECQAGINEVARCIVDVGRGVALWGQSIEENADADPRRGSAARGYKRDEAKKQTSNVQVQQNSFDKLQNHYKVRTFVHVCWHEAPKAGIVIYRRYQNIKTLQNW